MKRSLLDLGVLCCPECGGDLDLSATREEGAEIMEGEFSCLGCQRRFGLKGGVPRLLPDLVPPEAVQTTEGFSYEWHLFDKILDVYEQQFLDWIAPVRPEFFKDKFVLEGGCGKGRHTALASRYGARAVVAMDLSSAVDVCFRNCGRKTNVHVIQGDILKPPLRDEFDYAYSVGVLHHLTDPRAGYVSLASKVKKGGHVSAWVYGREGNWWIIGILNPIRLAITSRLPKGLLLAFSWVLTLPLWLAVKLVYGPLGRGPLKPLGRFLFYFDYLSYISRLSFWDLHSLVFDHLVPSLAFYIRRSEVEEWVHAANGELKDIGWHNRNSWRFLAHVPLGKV